MKVLKKPNKSIKFTGKLSFSIVISFLSSFFYFFPLFQSLFRCLQIGNYTKSGEYHLETLQSWRLIKIPPILFCTSDGDGRWQDQGIRDGEVMLFLLNVRRMISFFSPLLGFTKDCMSKKASFNFLLFHFIRCFWVERLNHLHQNLRNHLINF
jgi:hypothetical protein